MRFKRPDKYYKVEYVTDISQRVYGVQFIAECLTLESATKAYEEALQIKGWNSGMLFIDLVETGTNRLIERTEISVDDVKSKLEGEENLDDLRPNNDDINKALKYLKNLIQSMDRICEEMNNNDRSINHSRHYNDARNAIVVVIDILQSGLDKGETKQWKNI